MNTFKKIECIDNFIIINRNNIANIRPIIIQNNNILILLFSFLDKSNNIIDILPNKKQ